MSHAVEPCPTCGGSGRASPGSADPACVLCRGSKTIPAVEVASRPFIHHEPGCPAATDDGECICGPRAGDELYCTNCRRTRLIQTRYISGEKVVYCNGTYCRRFWKRVAAAKVKTYFPGDAMRDSLLRLAREFGVEHDSSITEEQLVDAVIIWWRTGRRPFWPNSSLMPDEQALAFVAPLPVADRFARFLADADKDLGVATPALALLARAAPELLQHARDLDEDVRAAREEFAKAWTPRLEYTLADLMRFAVTEAQRGEKSVRLCGDLAAVLREYVSLTSTAQSLLQRWDAVEKDRSE